MARQPNQPVTKEVVEYIVKNWDTMSSHEIAKNLGRTETNITYITWLIRKAGHPLKHHPKGIRQKKPNKVKKFLTEIGAFIKLA